MPFCPKSGSDSQGKRDSVAEGGGVSEANIETRVDKLARYNNAMIRHGVAEGGGVSEANIETRIDKLARYNEYYDWTRLRREVVFIETRFDKLARYNECYDWTRRCRKEVNFQ